MFQIFCIFCLVFAESVKNCITYEKSVKNLSIFFSKKWHVYTLHILYTSLSCCRFSAEYAEYVSCKISIFWFWTSTLASQSGTNCHLAGPQSVRIPDFPAVFPHFSAKTTGVFRTPESAHFGLVQCSRGVYNSAVEGAMTRPAHVRVPANSTLYLVTAAWLTCIFQQYSTDSSGAFSVGVHAPARILGPARMQNCSDWPNDCKLCFTQF